MLRQEQTDRVQHHTYDITIRLHCIKSNSKMALGLRLELGLELGLELNLRIYI